MYTKQSVLTHLYSLEAYSKNQESDFASQFSALMSPMYSAVNAYFNADRSAFKKPLDDLGLYLHNELWQRGATWEGNFDMGFGTNPPPTYNDLRELFHKHPCMSVTPEQFHAAWVFGVPEEGGLEPEPISNSFIGLWVAELSTALQDELNAISALGDWLESSMSQCGSVMLWEDTGALVEAPTTRSIAKIVFEDRGLLEAINILGLPVYVPTYLREGE